MMPAAKHGDPQMGVDIHLCVVPPSPSPVPLPTPHMSIVFDPFDYVPFLGATVTVCGMKRATAGTNATVIHIPPGFPFAPKLPDKDDELFMGSSTVVADGDPMSHISHPVLGCQVAGLISPPRLKKKNKGMMLLPTTFNLAIPTNVFVGGPPTISLIGMLSKLGFAALGRFAKSALFKRMRQRLFGHMTPGFLKCMILRAEPVNILSGAVSVEHKDFILPGRIPIEWQRTYSSSAHRTGWCGYGWETPADIRLEIDGTKGNVTMIHPTDGPLFFERLPVAEGIDAAELELMDGALFSDHSDEFRVRTKEDRVYHFAKALRVNATSATECAIGSAEYPVTRISDLCGNWLEYQRRDAKLVGINESAGRRIELVSENGRIIEVALTLPGTEIRHVFVRYQYDAAGDLLSAIDALDKPYTFAYERHRMVRHTDRNGLSFDYEYEQSAKGEWRVIHAWGDGGLYDYTFEYFDPLNERRITDSLEHTSIVKLNEAGFPISEIDPLGGLTIFEYDDQGRASAVVDQDGNRTDYEYDGRGNLLKLTRPDGKSIQTEFNHSNKATKISDPNGAQWQQRWDARGLLMERTSPLGHISHYEYEARGHLVAFVNSRGARTELAFDDFGNLTGLKDGLNHRTQFAYDALGNVIARADPLDRKTLYGYDAKSRLVGLKLPSGSTIACAYDAEDNLTRYVDENGAETRLEYFGQHEIARRFQPDGYSIEYLYDTEERLIGARNQRGELYELKRDPLGRITEEIDYWGQSRAYRYSACGYIEQSIDPLGRRIDYTTDPLGRIVKKLLPEGLFEEFACDANGNLTGTKNAHAEITRTFDAEGQLLQEKQGERFTIENTYDVVGNRIARKTSLGNYVEYKFDLLDQISSVRINGAEPIGIERDATGQITHETLAAGLDRHLSFDADNLLIEQSIAAGEIPLFATRYEYDRAGNLTRRSDSHYGADIYRYDPLGRVLEHVDPQGRLIRYLNDPVGDRLTTRTIECRPAAEPSAGDANDEWSREGGYQGMHYRFDRVGNLVERFDGERDLRLAWDANQRLIESRTNDTITHYGYDPLGRRLFKETNGVRKLFFWDGDALVGEYSVSAEIEAATRPVREFLYYPGTFEPLAMLVIDSNGTQVFHYYNDPNGCPTRLLDPAGLVVWAAQYNVWGAVAELYIDEQDNPLRLQGQYYDLETDLCFNLNRYYDPQLGCFVSKDPVGLTGGLNIYAYAPNIWTWFDPLGLACEAVERGMAHARQKLDEGAGALGHARRSMSSAPTHGRFWKNLARDINALIRREGREAVPDTDAIDEMRGMLGEISERIAD